MKVVTDSSPRTDRREECFPGMTVTFASIQIVGKTAERSSPSSCDGVDDECVEFCKENEAVDPTTVECCANVDLMALKAPRRVSRPSTPQKLPERGLRQGVVHVKMEAGYMA